MQVRNSKNKLAKLNARQYSTDTDVPNDEYLQLIAKYDVVVKENKSLEEANLEMSEAVVAYEEQIDQLKLSKHDHCYANVRHLV